MTFAPTLIVEVEQGVDEELRLIWRDGVTNLPVDLTGWTAVMRVSTVPLTLLTPVLGGVAGTIVTELDNVMTTLIGEAAKPHFELDLTDPGGKIKRFVKGQFKMARSLA